MIEVVDFLKTHTPAGRYEVQIDMRVENCPQLHVMAAIVLQPSYARRVLHERGFFLHKFTTVRVPLEGHISRGQLYIRSCLRRPPLQRINDRLSRSDLPVREKQYIRIYHINRAPFLRSVPHNSPRASPSPQ